MTTQNTKEDIIDLAKQTLYYTDLLIVQCNRWLPEEEGIKYVEKQIKRPPSVSFLVTNHRPKVDANRKGKQRTQLR